MILTLLLVTTTSSVVLSDQSSEVVSEELYSQLHSLEQMISLVRNTRSVTGDLDDDEDDQEIMDIMEKVDLSDSTNVDAVADVLKTLPGGKQMEFLMTKVMMGRVEDQGLTEQSSDVEEEEPMLSRQRRYISEMFSYFTGDSEEPQSEPDSSHYSLTEPEPEFEPSYPEKAVKSQQFLHRHQRSPYPQPEPQPQGIHICHIISVTTLKSLIIKGLTRLCFTKVRATLVTRIT